MAVIGSRRCGEEYREITGLLPEEAAGLRRLVRADGTLVGVYDGPAAGLDDDDGRQRWSTICERHGACICHATLSLANAHASVPLGWCEECRDAADGAEP